MRPGARRETMRLSNQLQDDPLREDHDDDHRPTDQ
jgi:hypothetical protein